MFDDCQSFKEFLKDHLYQKYSQYWKIAIVLEWSLRSTVEVKVCHLRENRIQQQTEVELSEEFINMFVVNIFITMT